MRSKCFQITISFMLISFSFPLLALPCGKKPKGGLWNGAKDFDKRPKQTKYDVRNSLFKWSPIASDCWCKVVCKMRQSWSRSENYWVENLKSWKSWKLLGYFLHPCFYQLWVSESGSWDKAPHLLYTQRELVRLIEILGFKDRVKHWKISPINFGNGT